MKSFLLALSIIILFGVSSFAQAPPQGFKYQAVAYETNGRPISNRTISFRFSILQGTANGASVFTETHSVTTNSNGLVSMVIGEGVVVSGNFSSISWGTDSYFLQVEMDRGGRRRGYNLMGVSQLQSVPYALYAATSGSSTPGPEGPMGPQGEKGEKGDIGLTGRQGEKGDQGDVGETGDRGAKGPQGDQGEKGDKGDTGETGPKGEKGDKGDVGETGDRGAIGPQGDQGEKGDTGEKGDKGDVGAQGATGATGPKGDKGDTGATGPEGKQGPKGDQGLQGIPGIQGVTGGTGEKGDKGDQGPAGASSYGAISPLEIVADTIRLKTGDTTALGDTVIYNNGSLISFDGTNWVVKERLINQTGVASNTNIQPFQVVNFIIAMQGVYPSRNAADPFIAEIIMFGGNFAPRGWALCDGQLLSISQNTALFSLLGTTYGGDGRTTFGLPDLRGRVPMHAGNGPGLSQRRLGEKGGAETTTNVISHTHTIAP